MLNIPVNTQSISICAGEKKKLEGHNHILITKKSSPFNGPAENTAMNRGDQGLPLFIEPVQKGGLHLDLGGFGGPWLGLAQGPGSISGGN